MKKETKPAGKEICIDTKKGIKYYFNKAKKEIKIVIDRGVLVGATHRAQDKSAVKFCSSIIAGTLLKVILHELTHAGMTLIVGEKVNSCTLMPGKGFDYTPLAILDCDIALLPPAKQALVYLAPVLLEVFAGLYLIRQGLKKRSPIRFGLGTTALVLSVGNTLRVWDKRIDIVQFASHIKEALIDYLGPNTDAAHVISHINDPALALIIAAMIYGTAFYGTKYVSKIELEYLPRDLRNKLVKVLSKIAEKDPDLHYAIVNNFFSKKARKWAQIIIEKLPKLKETLR